jgi:hypothetical protein
MTTKGFFSAVQDRNNPTRVLVRARCKEDIDALAEYLPNSKPWRLVRSDYEWRLSCTAIEWASVLMEFALAIDYDNFKNAVKREQGPERAWIYTRVWSALLALEPFGRYTSWFGDSGHGRKHSKPKKKKGKVKKRG